MVGWLFYQQVVERVALAGRTLVAWPSTRTRTTDFSVVVGALLGLE